MYVSLGIIDLVILFLALQGVVLSVFLAYSAKKIKNNYWVAALIFVIAETALVNEVMQSGFWLAHTRIIPFVPILRFAIGPLLYFYIRGMVSGDVKLRRKEYLHFLPLLLDAQSQIIALLYITKILSIPFVQHFYFLPSVQGFLFNRGILDNLPSFFSLLIYSIVCCRLILHHLSDPSLSVYKLADLKRARNIIYVFFGVIAVWLITILRFVYSYAWNYYILYIPVTMFIYWMGMVTYRRHSGMTVQEIFDYQKPQAKEYFTNSEANIYINQLIHLMESEKIYLDPSLKMDILAGKLSLSERSISNLLNRHVGKSFNDFVNGYRIEEAKRKLTDPARHQFTVAAIGFDCGFNSLATFQRCFKQFTGITPSQYQKFTPAEIVLKS